VILNGCQAETVVGLPWAADSCPWVGKLRTVLPLSDVIRDSAVQLVLTHQRGAVGVDPSTQLPAVGADRNETHLTDHLRQHAAVQHRQPAVLAVPRRHHQLVRVRATCATCATCVRCLAHHQVAHGPDGRERVHHRQLVRTPPRAHLQSGQ
jgi:hypothetical protein